MSHKSDVIDDDGNVIAPPEPGTPVAQIIYLLEWGRKRGFEIGPRIQVGDTTLEVKDLRQKAAQAAQAGAGRVPDLVPGSDMAALLGDE